VADDRKSVAGIRKSVAGGRKSVGSIGKSLECRRSRQDSVNTE